MKIWRGLHRIANGSLTMLNRAALMKPVSEGLLISTDLSCSRLGQDRLLSAASLTAAAFPYIKTTLHHQHHCITLPARG